LIYHAKGEPDEALRYHKQALELHRQIGYVQGEASDLGNIGLIYRDKGEPDEALRYLKQALEQFSQLGMPRKIRWIEEELSELKSEKRAKTI